MSKIRRWWDLFYASILPAKDAITGAVKIGTALIKLIPFAALGGIGLWLWVVQTPVPAWMFVPVPVAVWLAWKAAVAWVQADGAKISMSDLQFNKDRNLYFVTVTNEGEKPVKPRVHLTNATNVEGKRLAWMHYSIEAAWRVPSWQLQAFLPAESGSLPVHGTHSDAAVFAFWALPGDATNQQMLGLPRQGMPKALGPPSRLELRQPIIVTITADCGDGNDNVPIDGNLCSKSFKLSPVTGSQEYLITPIEPKG
jgi:hypothetical protein